MPEGIIISIKFTLIVLRIIKGTEIPRNGVSISFCRMIYACDMLGTLSGLNAYKVKGSQLFVDVLTSNKVNWTRHTWV